MSFYDKLTYFIANFFLILGIILGIIGLGILAAAFAVGVYFM